MGPEGSEPRTPADDVHHVLRWLIHVRRPQRCMSSHTLERSRKICKAAKDKGYLKHVLHRVFEALEHDIQPWTIASTTRDVHGLEYLDSELCGNGTRLARKPLLMRCARLKLRTLEIAAAIVRWPPR